MMTLAGRGAPIYDRHRMTAQPDPQTWHDPHPRAQALSARGRGLSKWLYDDRLVQWLLYIGIAPLNTMVAFSKIIVLIFLGAGGLAILLRLKQTGLRAALDWPLYVYPLFGLLSVLWSINPNLTMRYGLQLLITILIGNCLAVHSGPRRTILMLFVSVAIANLLSLVYPNLRPDGIPTGIFGSKNNYAAQIAALLLLSASIAPDRRQPFGFRVAAIAALVAMPGLLFKAQSVGALVTVAPALLLMIAIMLSARLPAAARYGVTLFTVIGAAVAVPMVIAASGMSRDQAMIAMGKDPNLTGRGAIWEMGWALVRERPFGGRGFQAFWVQGNLDAEGIWNFAGIRTRMGFHFHNMYVEAAVELGYVGLGILVVFLLWLIARTLIWALRTPSPASAFFAGIVAFVTFRSYAEVEVFAQFGTMMIMLCVIWAYTSSRPPPEEEEAAAPPRRIRRWRHHGRETPQPQA